jgi:diadenosine tetraphosphatase ApaH/serine/threonine PP2A family protein phosphatase
MINPGSVGQPRDGDPRASFVVFDTEDGNTEFLRLDYVIGAVCTKIKDRVPHVQELIIFSDGGTDSKKIGCQLDLGLSDCTYCYFMCSGFILLYQI